MIALWSYRIGPSVPKLAFSQYRLKYSADPIIYSFYLKGYGTMQFPEKNTCCIAGFSDKVFDVMKLLETDKQALIHEVEKINIVVGVKPDLISSDVAV